LFCQHIKQFIFFIFAKKKIYVWGRGDFLGIWGLWGRVKKKTGN